MRKSPFLGSLFLVFVACLFEGSQEEEQQGGQKVSSRIVVTFIEYRACNIWNNFLSSSTQPPCASMAKCYGRRLVLDVSNCYSKQSVDEVVQNLKSSSTDAPIISVEDDAEVTAGSIFVEGSISDDVVQNLNSSSTDASIITAEEDAEVTAGSVFAEGSISDDFVQNLNSSSTDASIITAEDGAEVTAGSVFVKGSISELMVTAGALDRVDNETIESWNDFNRVQASTLPSNSDVLTGSIQLPTLLVLEGQQQSSQIISNPDAMQQWNLQLLGVPSMWESGKTGTGTVMAVLDSGVAASALPMFVNHLQDGYDFVSDAEFSKDGDGRDPNPLDPGDRDDLLCPSSSSWHGTYVSSVAASRRFDEAFSGIAFNTTLLSVRVLGR
jgi:hypothetical protein